MIDIHKIDRVIFQPTRNLALKIHVKLLKERDGRTENFHNVFPVNGNNYLKLDLQSFLTLEIIKDGDWAKDKSILIDQRNIYHIIKGLKECIDKIYNGGIFAITKENKTIRYQDKAEEHTVRLFNLGMNQRMVLVPSVITDENEITYEGVIMHLNRTENMVEITIDALESLCYALEQTNLFVYSQLLINYYVSAIQNEKIELKQVYIGKQAKPTTKNTHKEIFLSGEQKENVTSTLNKKDITQDTFGYE